MLKVHGSTEPDIVSRYFDKRGWSGEPRTHAEVVEVYRPRWGWQRLAQRRRVSEDLVMVYEAEGITAITLRCRYGGSRVVSAEFTVEELL